VLWEFVKFKCGGGNVLVGDSRKKKLNDQKFKEKSKRCVVCHELQNEGGKKEEI